MVSDLRSDYNSISNTQGKLNNKLNNSAANDQVRVRYAPSPTGYLHVGGARTALYNYLFAKKNNGKFILRIEDTDTARSTDESLKMILDDLIWLGLNWDEGPNPETLKDMGDFGPYRQSQRQDIYKKYADQLIQSGKAYYCFMTDEEIEAQKKQNENKNQHLQSPYADMPLAEAQKKLAAGETAVVRFKTKDIKKDYLLNDLVRGDVKFPSDMVGDFVLLRSDGMPVYNFCCVVDDYLMQISHVIRAEEHLPNTLRQLMIYEGLGWQLPQFGHVSLILDDDRQKLSKRKGAVACSQFREEGYLPEALINFLVLLGWTHPDEKEVFSKEEMQSVFSLEKMHVSGAVFDRVKLKWMNAQHLRALSNESIWKLISKDLDKEGIKYPSDKNWQINSVEVFKSYLELVTDAVKFYSQIDDAKFDVKEESKETMAWESSKLVVSTWLNKLQQIKKEYITEDEFLKLQDSVKDEAKVKGKFLFMPIRVAVIGVPHGTELKILVPLLKISSLIQRAEKVLAKI